MAKKGIAWRDNNPQEVCPMMYRPIEPTEYEVLGGFLYEAIFVPEGAEPLPRDVVAHP
jgi:hypothetical protein